LKVSKDGSGLRGSGKRNSHEQAAPQEEHQSFFHSTSQFLFFPERKTTAVESGCFTRVQMRTKWFLNDSVLDGSAALFPNEKLQTQ